MSAFGGLILTNKGRALQAKAQTGIELHFTKILLGDGELGGSSILDLAALKHEVKSLNLTKLKTLTDGKAVVGGILSNQGLISGFYWRELGLFAQDPDAGEILYCYGNAGANAEYIPAGGGADIIEKSIDVIAIVGNATNVTATIDQSLIFASQKDIENKVDKIQGKQLSTEDYTTQEKQKLASLSNYSHPSEHPASIIKMADGSTVEDKITTHLADIANKIDITKGAALIGMKPITGLTGDNVRTAIQNLFQFANDGKIGEANVIGSPALATDSFAKLNGYIQVDKNTLATNLTAKGQPSVGTETLAALVTKVANVNTGKKWAKGNISSISPYLSNTVQNLDFIPTMIMLAYLDYNNQPAYRFDGLLKNQSSGVNEWVDMATAYGFLRVPTQPNDKKFIIENYHSSAAMSSIEWIAFE